MSANVGHFSQILQKIVISAGSQPACQPAGPGNLMKRETYPLFVTFVSDLA